MKKNWLWKSLFVVGLILLLLPVLLSFNRMSSLSFLDWMIMYLYLYWPTYILGIVLMIVSSVQLRK